MWGIDLLCPICNSDVVDLKSHFINTHGLDCECDFSVLLDFFELYRSGNLKPIVKCLEDFTFNDFVAFLEDIDRLIVWDYPLKYASVEKLINYVAVKLKDNDIDVLYRIASRDPNKSSSLVAFFTLAKSNNERAMLALLKLSTLEIYSDYSELIISFIKRLGDRALDLFKKYAPESYPFNMNLFYEVLTEIYGEKVVDVFIDVFEMLSSVKLREDGEEAYNFLDFAYGLSKTKFGPKRPRNIVKLLKTIVLKFEGEVNPDLVDDDFVYDALTVFDGLSYFFASEETGLIAWKEIQLEELLNVLKKFFMDFVGRLIVERENLVKAKLLLDKLSVKILDKILEAFKFNILKIRFVEIFQNLLYHYGKLELVEFLIRKVLSLAEKFNLKNVTWSLLQQYIRVLLLEEKTEDIDRLLNKYEKLEIPYADEETKLNIKFETLKLKFLYLIIKGDYKESLKIAEELKSSEYYELSDEEVWDWVNILHAYAHYKMGNEEEAQKTLMNVSFKMDLEELDIAKKLMFLQWKIVERYFEGVLKKLLENPKDKILFLDYLQIYMPVLYTEFLKYAISKYPNDPELNYYYAALNLQKREVIKAYENYIKAYKSKEISKKQIAKNILHTLLLGNYTELARKVYIKLDRYFSNREKLILGIIEKIKRGEHIKAKKIAKQLKKISPEDYYHVIKILKKGKIIDDLLPITLLGNPKNKKLKKYPLII